MFLLFAFTDTQQGTGHIFIGEKPIRRCKTVPWDVNHTGQTTLKEWYQHIFLPDMRDAREAKTEMINHHDHFGLRKITPEIGRYTPILSIWKS